MFSAGSTKIAPSGNTNSSWEVGFTRCPGIVSHVLVQLQRFSSLFVGLVAASLNQPF